MTRPRHSDEVLHARRLVGLRALLRRREIALQVAEQVRALLPRCVEIAATVAAVDDRDNELPGVADVPTAKAAKRLELAASGCESIASSATHLLSVADLRGLPVDLADAIRAALQEDEED